MWVDVLRRLSEQPLVVTAVAFAIACIIALIAQRFMRPSFRRRALMTENELEFHRRLLTALPDAEIWPQVPILALLEPRSRRGSVLWRRGFKMISNRRVDWVIAKRGNPLLIVELDDKTHDAGNDKKRDQLLASCNFPVLRYGSQFKPLPEEIRRDVMKVL